LWRFQQLLVGALMILDKYEKFANLSDAEKTEARLAWLEWKMVEVLWLLVSLTSALSAALITWFISEMIGSQSPWFRAPVFVFAWLMIGLLLQRRTFRGAPPHIDLIDP
jgi:hypothetical protein